MNVLTKVTLATLTLSLFAVPRANAGIPIEKACGQVFEEGKEESAVVNVGKHGFVIKKRKSSVERAEGKITVKGYFWHVIKGQNDRVFYKIVVEKGKPYQATIDRIELGGLFGDHSKLNVGITWTSKVGGGLAGAVVTKSAGGVAEGVGIAEAIGNLVVNAANAVQRKLIGNWTPGIPVILDGMANYFAKPL